MQDTVEGGLMSSILHSAAAAAAAGAGAGAVAGSNPLTGHSSSPVMSFTLCALHAALEQ